MDNQQLVTEINQLNEDIKKLEEQLKNLKAERDLKRNRLKVNVIIKKHGVSDVDDKFITTILDTGRPEAFF